MLLLVDLVSKRVDVCAAIGKIRNNPATTHLPVIAFADEKEEALQKAASAAGATLVVTDTAILTHLTQFIERALQVE